MTSKARIEKGMWWDKAWTLTKGCTPVSEGCESCWAATMSHIRSFQKNEKMKEIYGGVTKDCKWTGRAEALPINLKVPFQTKKSTTFAIWNDLFHSDIPFEFIAAAFGVMASSPHHKFFILTKRPNSMASFFRWLNSTSFTKAIQIRACLTSMKKYLYNNVPIITYPHPGPHVSYPDWPLFNVYLGVTVENNKHLHRICSLFKCLASKYFISAEPLIGELNISPYISKLDLVLVGGETGPKARPMHPAWVRSIRDQCQDSGTSFFFKSWGEWTRREGCEDEVKSISPLGEIRPNFTQTAERALEKNFLCPSPIEGSVNMVMVGKKKAGRDLDGRTWEEFPDERN